MMALAKGAVDVGIVVGDIKASLNFYQGILGLHLSEERSIASGQMYRLTCGNSDLKLVHPHTRPMAGPVGVHGQLGFRYLTFIVTNLSELCAELRERGTEFVVNEKEARPGVWIAMVKDPDGNIVEFAQRD